MVVILRLVSAMLLVRLVTVRFMLVTRAIKLFSSGALPAGVMLRLAQGRFKLPITCLYVVAID
jgi:hypothetical protein